MSNLGRVLSIDYGDVRVGLAISDELRITAQGIDNLVINGSDKKFFSGINEIIKKYNINEIVIGNPKNMDGTKSLKTQKIEKLILELKKLNIPIHLIDERLTTVSSYKTMRELGISQKKKNIYADKLAATYILEIFLNKK